MSAKARLRLDGADPINAGLLGFWPLAENGGNIALDISPLRGSGLLTNAPSRVVGRMGRGVALNGSTQYIATTRAQSLTTFSAVAWINVTPATGNNQAILSSMRGVDNTILWQISAGQTMEFWANTTVPNASSGTFADVRGTWACVGVSWAIGRSTNFYVGGRLIGTSSTSGDIQTPITGWNLGRYGVPANRYFNGSLAMVRTWGRVLQPVEFMRLYRDPWAGTARPRRLGASAQTSITGTAAITFADMTIAGAGSVLMRGAANITFDAMTVAGAGLQGQQGNAAITLGALTLAGTGLQGQQGNAAITFADMTVAGEGVATATAAHGRVTRHRRYRAWQDVPNELAPVVSLAENYADEALVQRAVDDALARFAAIKARTSIARRERLVDDLKRVIVAAVERAAEQDDEDAMIALL